MKAAVAAVAALLSLLTVAALVMTFGFAYWAIFSPGRDDALADASFVTFLATFVLAAVSAAAWCAWDAVRSL